MQDPGETLDAHNDKRRRHGVQDLTWDDNLARFADNWVIPWNELSNYHDHAVHLNFIRTASVLAHSN